MLVSAHVASSFAFLLPTPRARHTYALSGRTAGSSSGSYSGSRIAPASWVLRAAADGEDDAPAPAAASSSSSGSSDDGGEAPAAASEGGSEGGRGRRVGTKRRRVRKDKVVDSREKERQEDVIRREFDRELVLEEFVAPRIVDRTKPLTPPPPPAEAMGEEGEEGAGEGAMEASSSAGVGSPLPPGLRYDPDEELPIPSEAALSLSDIATRFDGSIAPEKKDEDSGDKLPSLAELGKRAQGNILRRQQEEKEAAMKELEPIDDYDLSAGILGEGRPVMGIGLPYLQSCHTVVLLVTLLCAFVEFPGFPLTNLPYEYRDFLKTGLVVIYFINGVLAFDSIKQAKKREQSVFFWALKCFVLGALAHNELLLIREKKQSSI